MPVFTVMREHLPHDRLPRAVRISLILGARTYCVSIAMYITKVLELSNLNRKVRNCAIFLGFKAAAIANSFEIGE